VAMVVFNLDDGVREMVDEAKAREIVEKAMAEIPAPGSVRSVRLSNKSYSESAALVIAEALRSMEGVTDADLSDMIAGKPEEEALKVLEAMCGGLAGRSLESLDLSDNAMGEKGIHACRAVLQGQSQLKTLKMCNDGLSASSMEAMRDILLRETPTSLHTLHFFNNMSGNGGAEALASMLVHCPDLENIRFSGTRAGREGSMAFAKALSECPAVQAGKLLRLDLADNTFGEEGGLILAEVLSRQPLLTYLNLRDAALEDEGVQAVTEALVESAPGLTLLDLSGNECTAESGEAIAACLKTKSCLVELYLEENELGSQGAKQIAVGIAKLDKLEKLQLNSNEIGTSGAIALVKRAMKLPGLKSLEMNGNELTEEGLVRVERMLESAGKAGVLGDMDDNDFEGGDEEEAAEEDEEEEAEEAAIELSQQGGDEGDKSKSDEDAVDALADALGKL
jgi:Ran GTPase-activating protein 1